VSRFMDFFLSTFFHLNVFFPFSLLNHAAGYFSPLSFAILIFDHEHFSTLFVFASHESVIKAVDFNQKSIYKRSVV
jgi:hypothetical protein